MGIISHKDWESLKTANQILNEKWGALERAHRQGKKEKVIAAEMQYLTALQNVVSLLHVATSDANLTKKKTIDTLPNI